LQFQIYWQLFSNFLSVGYNSITYQLEMQNLLRKKLWTPNTLKSNLRGTSTYQIFKGIAFLIFHGTITSYSWPFKSNEENSSTTICTHSVISITPLLPFIHSHQQTSPQY
jgi:hypothetical protein